jgi:hypothetical protein
VKHRFVIVALLLAAWLGVAGPARADVVRLAARESVTIDVPGAIAAFAVDPSTVETAVVAGQLVLLGRRAGDTVVTVVTAGQTFTLQVHIDPPAPLASMRDAARHQNRGVWESRYDTGLRRLSTSLSAQFGQGDMASRLRVDALRQQELRGQRAYTALPFASLELQSPGRSLVLLDQLLRTSPLTLDGVVLRGAHAREGDVEVHAGLASISPTEDPLVPRNADRAASVAWHTQFGPLKVVPSVVWLPDSGTSMPGAVSVGVEGGRGADPLQYRAEVGYSGTPGGSFEADYRRDGSQGWIRGVHRPSEFASTRAGRPAGTSLEGAWTEPFSPATVLSVNGAASRVDVHGGHATGASAGADLRHEFADKWSATLAASTGMYRGTEGARVTRGTVAVGAAYEGTNAGVTAQLRHQQSSLADSGGNGGRLSIRAAEGGWRASAYIDAQQQAATLDLILRGDPDVRRAMTELGIAASQPEEVVRQLRDNAALLASRGVMIGELRLNPLRVQAGVDVSWRGQGEARPELGLRLIEDRAQGVTDGRRALVGSLYANWRLTQDVDVGVAYSRWSLRQGSFDADANSSFQFMLRTRFDALAVPGQGSRSITGVVMRNAGPDADAAAVPAPGIDVILDRGRRTRTDAEGRFSFDNPGSGSHRIDVALPPQPGVYFTSSSMQTVEPGGYANFSMNFSGARLSGTVRDDAGQPIGGVTVRVEGPSTATAITDSNGVYRLGSPPGEARIFVVAETLPPGYEVANIPPRARALALSEPVVVNFAIRAQRSIEGTAMCGNNTAPLVRVQEIAREAAPDDKGRFVLRRMPAGVHTLVATCPTGDIKASINVPAEPGIVRGAKLGP